MMTIPRSIDGPELVQAGLFNRIENYIDSKNNLRRFKMAVSNLSLMSDERYAKEWNKLMGIRTQLTAADRNLNELNLKAPGDEVETNKRLKVDAILAGTDPDLVESSNWRADLDKARERYRLLFAAEKAQRDILQQERLRASKVIAESVKKEYSETVRGIALTLIEVGKAALKERNLGDTLRAEDVSFYQVFQPMPLNILGSPLDPTARISLWLKETLRLEYISETDIPKEWREAWKKGVGLYEHAPMRQEEWGKPERPRTDSRRKGRYLPFAP